MTKLINLQLAWREETGKGFSEFVGFGSPAALERCDGTSH